MRKLWRCGATVMAAVALGAVTASAAGAAEVEAGLLYLASESGQVTLEGKGGKGTLTASAGTISCEAGKGAAASTQTEKHVTSGTATITLTGCKETKGESKVACRTEGAVAEEVVLPIAFTLFNALDAATKKVLEPGVGGTLTSTIKLKCGAVAIVEGKGTVLGLITGVSLTADVTAGNLHFANAGEVCDSENVFCKKAQEKANELLCNFSGTFEKCTIEDEVSGSINKMVLVDD